MLIAARAIQGLAGATLAPSALALVPVLFVDEKQRTAALGVWASRNDANGLPPSRVQPPGSLSPPCQNAGCGVAGGVASGVWVVAASARRDARRQLRQAG